MDFESRGPAYSYPCNRKSQIAIEFSHRYHAQHPDQWIFYIHAGTKARLTHDYRNIATVIKLPGYEEPMADILTLVKDWLSDIDNGRWLMIIDNADDRDVFFEDEDGIATPSSDHDDRPFLSYIPQSAHGNILITSRNHTYVCSI